MPALGVREGNERDEASGLGRIVVRDRGLEVLSLRSRLAELPPEPAKEADGCLIGHS